MCWLIMTSSTVSRMVFYLRGPVTLKEHTTALLKCIWESGNLWKSHMASLMCSVCKESTCNAGDAGSIPGSGRSAGEGMGYPL